MWALRIRRHSAWKVCDHHAVKVFADQFPHPLAHLFRRFIGEGHGQDAGGFNALLEQLGNAAGDDPGLAGAGSGKQQQRAVFVQYGGALLGIEAVEIEHGRFFRRERKRRADDSMFHRRVAIVMMCIGICS